MKLMIGDVIEVVADVALKGLEKSEQYKLLRITIKKSNLNVKRGVYWFKNVNNVGFNDAVIALYADEVDVQIVEGNLKC